MNEDEIVETSDAEEREDLRPSDPIHWSDIVSNDIRRRTDEYSPRKRVKFSHLSPEAVPRLRLPSSVTPWRTPSPTQSLANITLPPDTPKSPIESQLQDIGFRNLLKHGNGQQQGEATKLHGGADVLPEDNSQDPLLLFTQKTEVPLLSEDVNGPSTSPTNSNSDVDGHFDAIPTPVKLPDSSRTNLRHRSQSADPMYLFSSPFRISNSQHISETIQDETGLSPTDNPLDYGSDVLFTPRKSIIARTSSSPLSLPPPTPQGAESIRGPSLTTSSPTPTANSRLPISEDLSQDTNDPAEVHGTGLVQRQDVPRYALRRRKARQINPYLHDQAAYKFALRANPDAIVKFHHHHTRAEDYINEEEQEQWNSDDDGTQDVVRRRRQGNASRSKSKSPGRASIAETSHNVRHPDVLQDLPSTDEEDEQMRALSKEARKMVKERKDNQVKDRRLAKKRVKAFPFVNQNSSIGATSPPFHAESNPQSLPLRKDRLDISSIKRGRSQDLEPAFAARSPSPEESRHSFGDKFSAHNLSDGLDVKSHVSPQGILKNTRETAIYVDDGDDVSADSHHQHATSDSGSSDGVGDGLDRKRRRALNRMIPAFMINRLTEGGKFTKPAARQRSVTACSDSDEKGRPLLPGQTRVRQAEYPKSLKDIRGDTESSDDRSSDEEFVSENMPGRTNSDSDIQFIAPRRREKRFTEHPINITDSSGSSNDGVDDEEIEAYLGNTTEPHAAPMREESLIDWMLARTRTVGGIKKSKIRKKSIHRRNRQASSRSHYKIDVITSGVGGRSERQTVLNFDRPSKHRSIGVDRNRLRPIASKKDSHPIPIGSSSRHGHSERTSGIQVTLDYDTTKSKSRKQKQKERRARIKAQGVYMFASHGTHLTTGRRETAFVTVDLEDDGFHKALAPLSQDWAKSYNPPRKTLRPKSKPQRRYKAGMADASSNLRKEHDTVSSEYGSQQEDITHNALDRRREIEGDFDIPFLHSGMSFGPTTFIGRGWLHELTNVISHALDPPRPTSFTMRGFELSAHMGVAEFSTALKNLFDGLFEFMTSLPDVDSGVHAKEWYLTMRTVCQLTSWLRVNASEGDQNVIQETVHEQILQMVKKVQELALESSSMDITSFSVCWFVVELSGRIGSRFPNEVSRATINPLVESSTLLVRHLLAYGLQETMRPICNEHTLDTSTIAQFTAELWICLFHMLNHCHTSDQERSYVHPLWQIVKTTLQSEDLSSKSNLEASEDIWRTIFSLCALSQFSLHGMTTATSRLPACWELVTIALKRIRLIADPTADSALSGRSLDKRDEYIGLIASRCFHLWDIWHWRLDDASVVFNQLVEIFRSRKFANLRHEAADFPMFMLRDDRTLLSQYQRVDTAFVLFLKLIVQAAGIEDDGTTIKVDLSPKVKKLLSLAIPVGSLSFHKAMHPSSVDLSMLYNRLSAIAINLYLDPAQHLSRLAKARGYVNFSDADDTTRLAVIRGMMYFSILMTDRKIQLDEIANWTQEMGRVLITELKDISKTNVEHENERPGHSSVVARGRLSFSIQMLLGSIRRIFEASKLKKQYPEPSLISSLSQIFRSPHLPSDVKTTNEIRRLVESFFDARTAATPVPERPRIVPVAADNNSESQEDYGVFDLDLNDPELIAALDEDIPSPLMAEQKAKDEATCQAIEQANLLWLSWRLLSKYFDYTKTTPFEAYSRQFDSWVSCWLGCANLLVRIKKKPWSSILDLLVEPWGKIEDDTWYRRMDMGVRYTLLKLDPMTYMVYSDRYIEIMLESLASAQVTIENEYLSLLLSIDGLQHPLLRGASFLPVPEADYNISGDEFAGLRLPILQTVFTNLNQLLYDEAVGNVALFQDNQKYVGSCIKMFSAMRSTCLSLLPATNTYQIYVEWCRQVFLAIQQYTEIRSQPRLVYWVNWARSLG